MFAPFKRTDGTEKPIEELEWSDLDQLRNLEEGFSLEFKQSFEGGVTTKVPKIIASFSNSRGGWLVVGVHDGDGTLMPIPRGTADYSQMVGELCRRHVSPAPRFEMRFVTNPEDHGTGVLVIHVFEGAFPPYVADGVVEVRVGSSSAPAAGTVLVDLYDKATQSRAAVSTFCRRTVYYAHADPQKPGGMPLFDLYLYQLGPRTHTRSPRELLGDCAEVMRRSFGREGLECHVQHAHDSLIFRASVASSTGEPHSAIELFADESMKLSVPAVLLEGDEREEAMRALAKATDIGDGSDARIVSARDTLRRVSHMSSVIDRYVRARTLRWEGYAVAYELENLAGVMLYSPEQVYLDHVSREGVLFCGTTDGLSRVRYLDEELHPSFQARQFAGSHFFEACGLPLGSRDPADEALVDALLRPQHD